MHTRVTTCQPSVLTAALPARTDAAACEPARTRYVLHGEIAAGGMATVHFGRLTGLAGFARTVAIKRLHPQYARDPEFVAMFLDEARLAARVVHPNVVPMLDVVQNGDELLLVMEYVRGASLGQIARILRARRERIPPLIATGVLSGVLHGLHAAHEAKDERGCKLDIVHRDVSPQNVLVGTDGVARVLDFGVAKAAGRLQTTRNGRLKGKLAYMAPEQIRGATATRRTDIYSAAVVLWESLTAQRLFRSDNEANILAAVLVGASRAPSAVVPGLAHALDRVVMRGLRLSPRERYATARAMALELEAAVGAASPAEIGEWVERVATRELAEQAARIEEIERGATGTRNHPRAPISARATRSPVAAENRAPPTPPSFPAVTVTQPTAGPLRRAHGRTRLLVPIGIGFALAVMLLVVLLAHRQPPQPPSVAIRPPVPLLAPTEEPAPPPILTPTATATTAVPIATAAARSSEHGATESKPDCNPPYTQDAIGHVHFKRECF